MTRAFIYWGAIGLCWALTGSTGWAQGSAPAPSQSQSAAAATATPAQNGAAPATPSDVKKPKKVWTNDDVNNLNGPVSVVGSAKKSGKASSESTADPQYIASVKKQLEKLRSQLDDTDKQLSDLKDFSDGKGATTSGGYEFTKGYNRVPVDQQISNLQAKKSQLEGKIDALLDEARKKGVEPGELR
ncbi:MAG: hypothetical protein WA765_02160 [Candidatus Acidiferrum sp.]